MGKNEATVNGDFSCVHVGCSAKLSRDDRGFLNEVQTIAEAFGASELQTFISNIRTGNQFLNPSYAMFLSDRADGNAAGTAQINKQGPECVRGCSRACQKQHWRRRGDNRNGKGRCTKARTSEDEAAAAVLSTASGALEVLAASAAAAGPLAEGNDDDLENPCPICLANEDDHGTYGQCFECGQLYCGACNGSSPIETCPTCRAPIEAPAEVLVKRLLRLVAREPGRHTPVAQANLGVMYANGTGVAQDDAEAARWHRLAADRGLAMAQCNLGSMYAHGIGVAQEHAEAVRWFRLAADQGLAMAQCNLGSAYMNGDGVPQDDAEAARWHHLAAEQDYQPAEALLRQLAADAPGLASRPITVKTDGVEIEPDWDNLAGVLFRKSTTRQRFLRPTLTTRADLIAVSKIAKNTKSETRPTPSPSSTIITL